LSPVMGEEQRPSPAKMLRPTPKAAPNPAVLAASSRARQSARSSAAPAPCLDDAGTDMAERSSRKKLTPKPPAIPPPARLLEPQGCEEREEHGESVEEPACIGNQEEVDEEEDVYVTSMLVPEDAARLYYAHLSGTKLEENDTPRQHNLDSAQQRRVREMLETGNFTSYDPAVNEDAWHQSPSLQQLCDVSDILHTHDTVASCFRNGPHRGESVQDLTDKLLRGETQAVDLPPLVLGRLKGALHAVTGNRRLVALKDFINQSPPGTTVKVRCLVYDLDSGGEVPPVIVAKLISSSTTDNDGASAAIRGHRQGRQTCWF